MWLLYFKAFHIIGFVSWFAGLFYWLRIFVYLAESLERDEPARGILFEQFTRMERRVFSIIVRPGLVITLIFGIGMLVLNPGYLQQPWLLIKLALIAALIGFQAFAKTYVTRIEEAQLIAKAERLRMMNEVPTVFLLLIVLLAVLRDGLSALAAFGITLTFIILLGLGIRYYRAFRLRNPSR